MFTKLFSSITTSSIWNEDSGTRIVWITMLALANKQGYVSASVGGLAHEARVDRETCEKALKILSSKDDDSRSKEFEGRRIEVVDGGFQLLNYDKYRAMRSEEERREYMKSYMVDYRRTKNVNKNVNNVSVCKPPLAKAEAEAEASKKRKAKTPSPPSADHQKFVSLWTERHLQRFGTPYLFQGAKDGVAAATLVKAGLSAEELVAIAEKAWASRDKFWCKNSVTIAGFASQFSQIRAEVGALVPKVVATGVFAEGAQ